MAKTVMDRRWLPLNAMRAFEGVAKHGSFTAAANALLISQSALSRHVLAIERLIGTALFERKPHALVLTSAGQHLLAAVSKSFDRLEYALEDIGSRGGEPVRRTLRVHMAPSFATQLAVPILRDFRKEVADIEIDIVSPYGVGSPPADADVAVIYAKPSVSDFVTDLLWPVHLSLLCHPELAKRHEGKDLAAFIEANETVHVRFADLPRHHVWEKFALQAGLGAMNFDRSLVFDTAALAVQYVLSGDGIALVDGHLFSNEIAEGKLVKPFDVTLDDGYGYYLCTHPDDLGDTAIAMFRSWLIQRFGSGVPTAAADAASPVRLVHSNG